VANNNNNWAAWERDDGICIHGQRAGQASDWWGGRWKEDFDRAADAGQNAHRFSIEWSRVQPTPDHWDEAALDRYREMARGLERRNMLPLVTLHHFTDPLWVAERGGWENEETPQLFNRYVAKVVEALKEYVTMWVTINEPNVYTYGLSERGFSPWKE
jgi:beta-glucosidase